MCFSADPNSGQPSTCWSDSLHIRKMSNENTKLARSMATGTSRQLKLNKAKADLIPWHETLLNRLISGLLSTTWCDFGKIDIPQFFNMVWIMYLYVLHYVAKDETCCSLPPNRKERQALKKNHLQPKNIEWGQHTGRNITGLHNKSTRQHWYEGNESSAFFLNPEVVELTPFGVFCAQAIERGRQTACWLLLLWKLAETKGHKNEGIRWHLRIKKQNKMRISFFSSPPFCYINLLSAVTRGGQGCG